jgi:hypothetical protein
MVTLNYNNKSSQSSFSSDYDTKILNRLKYLNNRQKMLTNFHELINSNPPILMNQNEFSIEEQNLSKRIQITLCIYNHNLLRNNHQIKLDKFNKKIVLFNQKDNNSIRSKPYLACPYDHLELDSSSSRTQSSHSIIYSNNIIENVLNVGNDYCLFSYGQNRTGK